MQRRYAIAVSLALTLIVGSAMVVLGSEVGLFFQHDRNSATATELNGDDEAAALRYLAAISQPPAEAEVYPPDVITQYDYRYIYETPVPAVPKQAITSPTAKPTTEPALEVADTDGEDEAPTPRDEAQPTLPARDESVDVDDDEHEDEHEDEHHEDEPQEEDHELATEDD
jgi:hypothetical protein